MKFSTLFILTIVLYGFNNVLFGQKISDGESLDMNGFQVNFTILNKESIEVKGKQFDRYKVSASVKNGTEKSLNIRLNSFPQIVNNTGIVELDCINATGAKLTSKKIELKMKAQTINVTYYSYDKNGKYVSSVIPVTGSYYFDPGDVVQDEAIFIVPQGEKPDVSVRSLQ